MNDDHKYDTIEDCIYDTIECQIDFITDYTSGVIYNSWGLPPRISGTYWPIVRILNVKTARA